MGKLPNEKLKELLNCIKAHPQVVIPPTPGFDSGVHKLNERELLVVSTDPCIGVPEEWFGWFLIHYAASDVALFGARGEYCSINILGPPSTTPEVFHRIMRQACDAADELEMAIVTGHTGTYEGLSTLLGVCTAYGVIDKTKLITPNGAKPGDYIFCIKPIGLETIVNFALTHKTLAEKLFGIQRTRELSDRVTQQSCVKEALLLANMEGVHALHDTTEGGLTTALNEMADVSKKGFTIEMEQIPIPEEVYLLQKCFQLSEEEVLSISSTGTLLAAVSPEAKQRAEEILRQNNIEARSLGVFTEDKHRILVKNGREASFPKRAHDPYEKILFRKP